MFSCTASISGIPFGQHAGKGPDHRREQESRDQTEETNGEKVSSGCCVGKGEVPT